jgi:hypothetical protein
MIGQKTKSNYSKGADIMVFDSKGSIEGIYQQQIGVELCRRMSQLSMGVELWWN